MAVGVSWSKLSKDAAGQCFGLVIDPSIHIGAFSIMENKLIGYADDSTLMADVPSPGVTDQGQ